VTASNAGGHWWRWSVCGLWRKQYDGGLTVGGVTWPLGFIPVRHVGSLAASGAFALVTGSQPLVLGICPAFRWYLSILGSDL
jgi:hypothetical protein